jgi:hypothetical protein
MPTISLKHSLSGISVKLPWARETNSWCIEVSSDLSDWTSLGELLEINGSGDFPTPSTHRDESRYYRAIHKGLNIQATLDRNRARWDQAGVTNYDFTFRWLCHCTPDYVASVNIAVRDDKIDAITRLDDGIALDPSLFRSYHTIDGLFDFLQEALDAKPHSISARFEPQFGTPSRAWVDYSAQLADEERGFVVEDLRLALVQITDTLPEELKLDPFSLRDATSTGSTLTVNLQHSGGCAEHEYELFMSPGAFLESFPVQANLYLRHHANGDQCRALITKELTFDLAPVADLYGQPGPIILNVHDYEQGGRVQVRWDR